MAQIATNEFRPGVKIEFEGHPYNIVANEFVKPGKGQAFNRVKIKHLLTGRTIEKTFKSGEKFDVADVNETQMRMLYAEQDGVVFMDDNTFDQVTVTNSNLEGVSQWLMEDKVYDLLIYNGEPVAVEAPTFVEMRITETEPWCQRRYSIWPSS